MCLFSWVDSKIKKMRWFDISLTKLSVMFVTLLLVKFFPVLVSLEWYWYLIVTLITATIIWFRILK